MRFKDILISITAVLFFGGYYLVDNWKSIMLNGDSSGYYMHVVSCFINQDIGDYSQTIDKYLEYNPDAADPRDDKFGIRKTPKGRYYIKYTLGVGVMEIPAFLIAHIFTIISDTYKTDGWSLPYIFCVNLSKVFYILIGLFFLIKILERYFSRSVIALTILSIAFATNLFFHGIFLTLAHSFLFFDFCLLIYISISFHENPNKKKAFVIGSLVGLIALTRVPEVISLCVPLLWGVQDPKSLKQRIHFLVKEYQYLLLASLGLILVFSPQLMYWYYVSGEIIFNPYQGETFNFLKPRIYKGWFHFKNGWLIYTPIMAFSLIGCVHLLKKIPEAILPIFCFVGLNAWIHYSYYVWNYYPGMGSRPMIECYPLLSFGLAAFYAVIWQRNNLKWLSIIIFAFFAWLNLFQSWQIRNGMIWTERGSLPFYWETFGTMTSSINSLRAYDTKKFQPKSSNIHLLDTLYWNDYEDSTLNHINGDLSNSGNFSLLNTSDETHSEVVINFEDKPIKPGHWIYVGIKAYRETQDMVWNRDALENLVIELLNEDGEIKRWSSIKIASHIGNDDFNIWHCGDQNVWGEAGFYARVPKSANPNWKLKVYVWNNDLHRMYLDDLEILHYKPL